MIIRKVKVTEYEYQAPINYVAGATEPDIQFQLTDYEIPSGATGRVYVGRSDGTFEYTVATISGNNVTVAPTNSMFSVKGPGAIQVTLYVGNEVVKNFAVPVYVHADLADDSAEAGSDVTGVFRAAEEQALADFAEDAEAKAAEVIESIPADYTELTEEVSELNERIGDLTDLETEDKTNLVSAINEAARSGITDEVKAALLACFEKVAWIDGNGQDYYDALYEALYRIEPTPPSEVPDGYTKFDYIKVNEPDSIYGQTGLLRSNQILLPLTGNKNAYKYEMLINNYAQSGAATFGGRDSSGSSDGLAFYITSSDPQTITIHCKGESYKSEKLSVLQQQEHTLHVIFDPSVNPTIVSVDDATVISRAWATPSQTTDAQLALFGNPASDSANDIYRGVFSDQIGRLKAYNSSNELVCDCIPCSNPFGKYGMYDTVSKTFITSTAVNTYICGNWN